VNRIIWWPKRTDPKDKPNDDGEKNPRNAAGAVAVEFVAGRL